MKKLIVIAICLVAAATGLAQSSAQQPAVIGELKPPVRLRSAERPVYMDELYTADGAEFFFRAGSGVSLPLTQGAPLRLGLDNSPITTAKLVSNLYTYRTLPLHSSIQSPYGPLVPTRDLQVETRISGNGSGVTKRALLIIEPQTMQVEISDTDYVQIGEKDGRPIYLKPGKWIFRLHCWLESIDADGYSWKAKRDSESSIKGGRFKFGSTTAPISDDVAVGLSVVNPLASISYGLVRLGGLVGMLFHRPNVTLPPMAELHFHVSYIEATYLSPPAPKTSAKKVIQ